MTANTSAQVYEGKIRQVAGCVFVLRSPAPHVLLISSRSDPSRWILPKGGYEAKDGSDPVTAAIRESWEEAGVRAADETRVVLLGTLDHTPKKKPHKPQKFWWYGYAADGVEGIKEFPAGPEWPEHEIRERAWFPLAEARKVLTKGNMVPALDWAVKQFGLIEPTAADAAAAPLTGSIIPIGKA
ncbi:hypothetical protein H9P43_000739 [Blastocladiella emersonii ATCC 22665]|nr:hypothetical protein H9P43_000739 [Blastocladiella emersonii ATCC 22665]